MSVNDRRRAIIEVLCLRRYDTRENLAFEFGVSTRTIERDILSLSLSYPIYTTQGNGGGIYVDKDYKLDKQYLNNKESALLEKLLSELSATDAEIMKSILAKFRLRK